MVPKVAQATAEIKNGTVGAGRQNLVPSFSGSGGVSADIADI